MSAPIRLSRKTIEDAPYEIWNAFVKIALSPYDELDSVQRVAHHALWYEHEVYNGGHLQYFENHGATRLNDVIAALRRIRANCQAEVLSRAAGLCASKPRTRIETVEEYVETALQGEYDEMDSAFYDCRPEVSQLLEEYLNENESSFVQRVE